MIRWLSALLLIVPLGAIAALPQPEAGALYADADPAAMAMQPGPGRNAQFRSELNRRIRANPRNAVALIQRAFALHASGDMVEGDRDFERVLALTEAKPDQRRRAYWSLGWSALNRAEPQQAIMHWQRAAELHGGRPFWYAYTMAVGSWAAGDRETALAWYTAAVLSRQEWGTASGMAERTRHWRKPEQAAMKAIFEAWSADAATAPAG